MSVLKENYIEELWKQYVLCDDEKHKDYLLHKIEMAKAFENAFESKKVAFNSPKKSESNDCDWTDKVVRCIDNSMMIESFELGVKYLCVKDNRRVLNCDNEEILEVMDMNNNIIRVHRKMFVLYK